MKRTNTRPDSFFTDYARSMALFLFDQTPCGAPPGSPRKRVTIFSPFLIYGIGQGFASVSASRVSPGQEDPSGPGDLDLCFRGVGIWRGRAEGRAETVTGSIPILNSCCLRSRRGEIPYKISAFLVDNLPLHPFNCHCGIGFQDVRPKVRWSGLRKTNSTRPRRL